VTGQAAVARLYQSRRLPPPNETMSFEVSYRLASRTTEVDRALLDSTDFGEYKKNREYRTFTRPEKKIESTDPDIRREAKMLKRLAKGPVEFAHSAYNWVMDRTQYKLIPKLGGARYCLTRGYGECSEYSALFVALCRAAGIPARPVVGFEADETDGWHVWAEFLLPNGEWVPVDASVGDENDDTRRFWFGNCENTRGVLCRTYDILFPKRKHRSHFAEIIQYGGLWWSTNHFQEGGRQPQITFTIAGRRVDATPQ
jgi:transglutaminase-like putative cysteine protease